MLPKCETKDDKKTAIPLKPESTLEESKQTQNEAQKDDSLKKSIISTDESTIAPPTLLTWCSLKNNEISIVDLETKQSYANFEGAKVRQRGANWTHVKEIPNTKLLVSLRHNYRISANMEIFDISKREKPKKIYSLGEVVGATGWGDVTYNARRNFLGANSLKGEIAYHLFNIDTSSKTDNIVKLIRRSKWQPQYSTLEKHYIFGLDFNPSGESVATISRLGRCLISDLNTNNCTLDLALGSEEEWSRCRWSTNSGEPLLFVKYDHNKLNILDVEKKALMLTGPVQLEKDRCSTYWVDVCQSDGNLLATGGADYNIKIYDKRESKIVKSFDDIHSTEIYCVRWNPSGNLLASASYDEKANVLDFKTGKVFHTGKTSDGSPVRSVCFI